MAGALDARPMPKNGVRKLLADRRLRNRILWLGVLEIRETAGFPMLRGVFLLLRASARLGEQASSLRPGTADRKGRPPVFALEIQPHARAGELAGLTVSGPSEPLAVRVSRFVRILAGHFPVGFDHHSIAASTTNLGTREVHIIDLASVTERRTEAYWVSSVETIQENAQRFYASLRQAGVANIARASRCAGGVCQGGKPRRGSHDGQRTRWDVVPGRHGGT